MLACFDGEKIFDTPKPTRLIQHFMAIAGMRSGLVMDFFAGSGTTAHAITNYNLSNNTDCKFLLVQLPEPIQHKKFKNIADITRARVQHVFKEAGKKTQGSLFNSNQGKPDHGFRVFKLVSSNFRRWETQDINEIKKLQAILPLHVSNIKGSASDLGKLFEILLRAGFSLSDRIEKIALKEGVVFSVQDRTFFICLEPKITKTMIHEIGSHSPIRLVMLDSAFAGNDQLKVNAVETFKAKGITFKTV